MQHTKTQPAIPRAMRRTDTLTGVAPCANAPAICISRTGYSTITHRASARTREAVRVDIIRRAGK